MPDMPNKYLHFLKCLFVKKLVTFSNKFHFKFDGLTFILIYARQNFSCGASHNECILDLRLKFKPFRGSRCTASNVQARAPANISGSVQ